MNLHYNVKDTFLVYFALNYYCYSLIRFPTKFHWCPTSAERSRYSLMLDYYFPKIVYFNWLYISRPTDGYSIQNSIVYIVYLTAMCRA